MFDIQYLFFLFFSLSYLLLFLFVNKESNDKPKDAPTKVPSADPAPKKISPLTPTDDLPNLDLASLKERSRSGKKKAPQSNWNNRQAMFNNL